MELALMSLGGHEGHSPNTTHVPVLLQPTRVNEPLVAFVLEVISDDVFAEIDLN